MDVQIEKRSIYDKSFNYYDLRNQKFRVAAYVRVSTSYEEQLRSFESQNDYYIKKISDNENWTLVNVYSDYAISGTNVSLRSEFIKMMKDVNRGKIDLILTKSISRFARNTFDTLNYIKILKERNIGIYFEEENIYTLNSSSNLIITVLSTIAQQESINLSSHVKLAFKQKMERGEPLGTIKCYGYDYDIETKELIINKEQAKIVRKIYEMYMDGKGTSLIARELTKEGVPTPSRKNTIWNEGVITRILKNEKICGDIMMQKYFTNDPFNNKCIENVGQKDKYLVRNHHEGIITREQFDELQKEINRRAEIRKPKVKTQNKKYVLSGKLKCGFCGSSLIRVDSNNSKLKYICSNRLTTSILKECNDSKLIDDVILKKAFMQAMKKLQRTIKNISKYSNVVNERLNYARLILAKYQDIDVEQFNEELFKEIVRYIKVGETEDDKKKYFTTRIVIKNESDFIIEDKITENELLSNNNYVLVDFYSNQVFHYYEKKDNSSKVKYVSRFRVIVEVNTNDW